MSYMCFGGSSGGQQDFLLIEKTSAATAEAVGLLRGSQSAYRSVVEVSVR